MPVVSEPIPQPAAPGSLSIFLKIVTVNPYYVTPASFFILTGIDFGYECMEEQLTCPVCLNS